MRFRKKALDVVANSKVAQMLGPEAVSTAGGEPGTPDDVRLLYGFDVKKEGDSDRHETDINRDRDTQGKATQSNKDADTQREYVCVCERERACVDAFVSW